MPFKFPDVPEDFEAGLAIKNIGGNSYHIGFIYCDDSGLKLCHLGWHHYLKNEPFSCASYLCDGFKLENVNNMYLSASFSLISNINSTSVPYGIKPPIESFNEENKYVGTIQGEGLTCATFILTVLEKNGFSILNKDSWKLRDEDSQWQKFIIGQLKTNPGLSETYIENAEKLIGSVVRFRPTEVFSCGVDDPEKWAVEFEDAIEAADEIIKLINAA